MREEGQKLPEFSMKLPTLDDPNVLMEFRERLSKSIETYPRIMEEAIIAETAQMVRDGRQIPYNVLWSEALVGVLDKMRLAHQANRAKEIIFENFDIKREQRAYTEPFKLYLA